MTPMKVLLSGYHNPRFATITEYVEEAIEELGHRLVSFDNRRYLVPGRIRRTIPPLERADLRRLNNGLLRLAGDCLPDVFVETGGHRILADTVESLRREGISTVLWTIDAPADFDPVLRAAPHYDLVVCGGTEAVQLLERGGVRDARWLPFGCAPRHHHPVTLSGEDRSRFGARVAFVGSYYPNRAEVLASIADLDLAIWGPGWDRLPEDHPLSPRIRGRHVAPAEWAKIYAASEIVVIVHFQDGHTPCRQASPKVYETLACGAFALVDDQPDVFSLFEDGRHLARFDDPGDLVAKVRFFLERPEDRARIADAGREAVISKHTYRHRVAALMEMLHERGQHPSSTSHPA